MSIFLDADIAIKQEAEKERAVAEKNSKMSTLVETLLDNELTKVIKAKDFRSKIEKKYKSITKEMIEEAHGNAAEVAKHKLRVLCSDLQPSSNIAAFAIYDLSKDEIKELTTKFGDRLLLADYASASSNRSRIESAIELIITCALQKNVARSLQTMVPYDKYYAEALEKVERKRKGLV